MGEFRAKSGNRTRLRRISAGRSTLPKERDVPAGTQVRVIHLREALPEKIKPSELSEGFVPKGIPGSNFLADFQKVERFLDSAHLNTK